VIIVAGGTGTRMTSRVPKQFIELKGTPVLIHTMNRFYEYDPEIHIIIPIYKDYIKDWEKIVKKTKLDIPHQLIPGGETRFHSVYNGLREVTGESLIAVHDAVRPLVDIETITRCFDVAQKKGVAIPCLPVAESVRLIKGEISEAQDREDLRLIQTPQVFQSEILKKSYQQEYREEFTDDATVVERAGFQVYLVEGNRKNIKITTDEDLALAEFYLENK